MPANGPHGRQQGFPWDYSYAMLDKWFTNVVAAIRDKGFGGGLCVCV